MRDVYDHTVATVYVNWHLQGLGKALWTQVQLLNSAALWAAHCGTVTMWGDHTTVCVVCTRVENKAQMFVCVCLGGGVSAGLHSPLSRMPL